jgi:hypothetical protein
MVVNAYAILDAFLVALRLILGTAIVTLALSAFRRESGADGRLHTEEQGSFLFLSAATLLGLSVVSWPVFYLLLQSYVSQWEGVMCIYGVTQIGAGSMGPARFLPGLLHALQLSKPLLGFLGGAWLVLHLLNGRTLSGPLAKRVLVALVALGTLAMLDALAEGSYLFIPKKEELASGGCCTQAFDNVMRTSRFLPMEWVDGSQRPWLFAGYFVVNGLTILSLLGALRLNLPSLALALPAVLVVIATAFNAVFLVEAAAPLLLHLPYHHCPYDLLPLAPESLVAIGLFLLGAFAVGWACLVQWLGGHPETAECQPWLIRKLLRIGLFGCLGSMVTMSLELAMAWAEQR